MAVKEFAGFISEQAGGRSAGLFAGAAITGLLQAAILLVLLGGLESYAREGRIAAYSYLCFLAALGAYFLTYRYSVGLGLSVALDFISRSQESITRHLLEMKYGEFKNLKPTEIYAALSINTGLITEGARFLPNCLAAFVLLICSLIYALTISLAGALSLIVMFGLVVGVFQILESEARVWREKAAGAGQSFMSGVEGLFGGFVELKMNQARREDYVRRRVLEPCAEASRQQREYEYIHMKGNCLYAVLNYLPAGIIAFVVPFYLDIPTSDLLKLIGVALFATPALVNLAMFEPLTSKAFDTVKALERLDEELSRKGENIAFEAEQKAPAFLDRLAIDDLQFAYPPAPGGGGQERFSLKIDHLELRRGELVIIHGGNGNGKSTFFKLLAGLNQPDQGRIAVDGREISQIGLNNYRALFSTVFSDFFLFDSLFGLKAGPGAIEEALRRVKLGPDVVRVLEDGRFSTSPQNLSSGQRKRLALACAMLEKRPVALFDEVAADFDPGFRLTFYQEILPSLKSSERLILAISHDDRFFGVADRVLKMDFNPQTSRAELIEEEAAQWRRPK